MLEYLVKTEDGQVLVALDPDAFIIPDDDEFDEEMNEFDIELAEK